MCRRYFCLFFFVWLAFSLTLFSQDELKVESWVAPAVVAQGEEGLLKIKITPRAGIRVSSHPEFMIRLAESDQFSFSKIFFTGSELNFQRIQEGDALFLDLQKDIEIPFQVNEEAFIGKHTIRGEIVFTILTSDNWYVKTSVKFSAAFTSKKLPNPGRKGGPQKKINELAVARYGSRFSPRYQAMVSSMADSKSIAGEK